MGNHPPLSLRQRPLVRMRADPSSASAGLALQIFDTLVYKAVPTVAFSASFA
jgi:hypothetical protein